MPEFRLEKTRATLPEGYQFGDAAGRFKVCVLCGEPACPPNHYIGLCTKQAKQLGGWAPWHENAAERLTHGAMKVNMGPSKVPITGDEPRKVPIVD
jgi:hypothetical protein